MKGCAEKDCNGPTLPNSEYCLMHRKLNKEVVNQERKSNSELQTSSGWLFGFVLLFILLFVFLGFLQMIDEVASATGGSGSSGACYGLIFLIFIAILVLFLKDMDEKTKDN
tara:strand:+ start:1922 stop:2254 length:333 start_codon:yes stop_codon:yes gene_type:complete